MYSRQPKARDFQRALAKKVADEWRGRQRELQDDNERLLDRIVQYEAVMSGYPAHMIDCVREAERKANTYAKIAEGMAHMDPEQYGWWRAEQVAKSINQKVKAIKFSPGGHVLTVTLTLSPH